MYYKVISSTTKGKNKKFNEDSYTVIETDNYELFFVFDGVSRAENGRLASHNSKQFVKYNHQYYWDGKNYFLEELINDLNEYLINTLFFEPYTTFVCLLKFKNNENVFYFNSLGDSKIFKFNKFSISQITTDDVIEQNSNVLSKCLGVRNLRFNDIKAKKIIFTGSGYLLCTDGFSHFLENDKKRFLEIFNTRLVGTIKKKIYQIIRNKNKDDSTYILIRKNV